MTRVLPNSLESEQALLGSMLLYPRCVRDAFELGLNVNDFYGEAHRIIYQACLDLQAQNIACDGPALRSYLQEKGQLNQVGGVEYLMVLAENATTQTYLKQYVDLVKNKSLLRALIESSHQIIEDTYQDPTEVSRILDQAEKSILNITRNRLTTSFLDTSTILQEVMRDIRTKKENRSQIIGLKTGLTSLDKMTNGFQNGDLIILAARPSMGKSALALNITKGVAESNQRQPVAFFSLEMPATQLMNRLLSIVSSIETSKIRTGFVNESELASLGLAEKQLREMPIMIDESPLVQIPEIFSKCRKLQSERGLALIVIDYIQLIASSTNTDNRQQQVSEISRNLKALARDLNVPVIALSQLNRDVEKREDKRPMLSDLRESGAIEQDADVIMMLYDDQYYKQKGKSEEKPKDAPSQFRQVEVIVAKHRNGPTGTVLLAFDRSLSRFYVTEKSDKGGQA